MNGYLKKVVLLMLILFLLKIIVADPFLAKKDRKNHIPHARIPASMVNPSR